MSEEVNYVLEKLGSAFERLKEGAAHASDELSRDGVIQRFEFTFELLWKTIKKFLEYKGIEVSTPRDCFKEAFKIGIIEDEEVVLDMLKDRNLTSHIYDQETAEEVFERTKTLYIPVIQDIIKRLQESA